MRDSVREPRSPGRKPRPGVRGPWLRRYASPRQRIGTLDQGNSPLRLFPRHRRWPSRRTRARPSGDRRFGSYRYRQVRSRWHERSRLGHRRIRATQISLRCMSALIFVRYRRAQRHIPRSRAMIVCPGRVNEYSTARGVESLAPLAINPEDSSLRRVLVSIRCETPGDGGPTPRVDKVFA
jgi:hypothetical protein